MTFFRSIRLALIAATIGGWSLAAGALSVTELPIREINGKRYYYYQTKGKETLYSLSHKLDLTQDEIISFNPTVYDGVRPNSVLYFPVEAFQSKETTSTGKNSQTPSPTKASSPSKAPKASGTISVDELGKANGQLQPAPLKTEVIGSDDNGNVESRIIPQVFYQDGAKKHRVLKGETLYGISKRYGITTDALIAANPETRSGLKSGMELTIPDAQAAPDTAERDKKVQAIIDSTAPVISEKVSKTPVEDAVKADLTAKAHSIDIAVLFPFDLGAEKRSRESANYLEFYKGFLLAVDTLRNFERPIHVTTLDIGASASALDQALQSPSLGKAQVIIAPGNTGGALNKIAEWGDANNVAVLNMFDVRDDAYLRNKMLLQGNVTHDIMFDKAATGFIERYRHSLPVFVKSENASADATSFQQHLIARLKNAGMEYKELTYSGTPDDKLFADIDAARDVVVIPAQGSQRDLNRLIPQIQALQKAAVGAEVTIFGYPEWIIYRGETKENLHKLGATYYSRFIDDPSDRYTTRIAEAYKKWYGTEISESVPRPGVMGFDTGIFLIRALKATDGDLSKDMPSYQGVQNGFKFTRKNGEGAVNERLFLVTYRPTGTVDYKEL